LESFLAARMLLLACLERHNGTKLGISSQAS
jgi:hypothetical protein